MVGRSSSLGQAVWFIVVAALLCGDARRLHEASAIVPGDASRSLVAAQVGAMSDLTDVPVIGGGIEIGESPEQAVER